MGNTAPKHLGLILDGNRRWARERGLPTAEGHRQGLQNLKKITKSALERGTAYVSAYVFSTENWQRDRDEVRHIMRLLKWALTHEVEQFHEQGIRLRIVGSRLKIGLSLARAIHHAEEMTKDNQRGTLLLCLDYGGQQEIVEAAKRIVEAGTKPDDITPELLSKFLYAPDVPPVDLTIRTSGEQRLSNFMLWENAYSEFYFEKHHWPEFSDADLDKAFADYAKRNRRHGK